MAGKNYRKRKYAKKKPVPSMAKSTPGNAFVVGGATQSSIKPGYAISKEFRSKVLKVIHGRDEKKYWIATIPTATGYSGFVDKLLDTSQGVSDFQQRIGDDIYLTSLQFKFKVGIADGSNLMRVIVFQYLEYIGTGTMPLVSDILASSLISTTQAPLAPYRKDSSMIYHIMYDKLFCLTSQSPQQIDQQLLVNFKHNKVQYDVNNNSYRNAPFILIISDSAAVPNPSLEWVSRVNYKEI